MQFDLFTSTARAQPQPSTSIPTAPVVETKQTLHDVVTIARVISLLAPRVKSLLTDPNAEPLGETEFLALASQGFGGTLAQAAFTIREAYDCLEGAIVRAIRDSAALFGPGITAEAAQQGLTALRSLSERLPAQKRRTVEGAELQQFSTPPGYGYLLARAAAITPADTVLEPSAGTGLLAVHANLAGATVVANEIAPFRASVLCALDFETYSENAEHLHSVLPAAIQPSVILMNPPFSAALHHSRRSQQTGGQHLSQALKRLRPNGRLCTIVGLPLFDGDRNAIDVALSVIAQTIAIRADLRISRDVYKTHGTSFPTRVLVIDKCAPDGQKIITGEELDLKDALALLEPLSASRLSLDPAAAAAPSRQPANVSRPSRAKPTIPSTPAPAENIVHFNRFGPAVEIPVSDKGISDIAAATHDSVYEPYSVQRLMVSTAIDHPTPLVTSLAMASVTPPAPTYRPMLPERLISDGIISLAQLEQVVYAGQAHTQFLPDGPRMGYFVGDGTGVGKGREGATIILDNFNRGRDKHIWLSYNSTLVEDARRDWQDIGNDPNTIFELRNIKTSDPIPFKRGILFASYDLLRSAEKDNPESGRPARRRLDQIIEWVGEDFDGVIILDEAHCMANAVESKGKRGRKKPSQRALCGVELQEKLPKARVVYSSATGATEVANLAYADRLGLWGRGTPFTSREEFIEAMTLGGIAALEVVARDLKALGLYNARALSFHGVEYDQLVHTLTPTQRTLYDTLARAWQKVLDHIDEAMDLADSKSNARARSAALSLFWSNNQRFWNQVLTALQMPTMIAAIEEDLKAGHAAVIQLTNTNEATMERALSAIAGSEDLDMLDMTPRDILLQYIKSGFPIAQYEEYEDESGNKQTRAALDSMGFPIINADAVAIRDNLLLELGSLPVPEGCLEQLINHFGESKVAEVTGRKRRAVRKRTDSGFQTEVQKRSSNANKAETKAFMDDKKPILVFSQAGGTGRSYHSDRTALNQRKRIHYLAQAGWSAFAAIQGFGRTNRTNQVHPPKYRLVSTDIKGHKRFISTIARRLEQLGALTRGQRTASSTSLFSTADNLENSYASDAVKRLIRDLHGGKVQDLSFEQFCAETGLNLINKETGALEESKLPTVQQFLNRLLSLTIDMQNGVFEHFETRLQGNIEVAIADGTYQVGVEMITAEKIVKVSDQVVWKAPNSDAQSRYVHLELYYPQKIYPIEDLKNAVGRDLKPARFMRNKVSRRVAAFLYLQRVTENDGKSRDVYKEVRPNKAGYADERHLNNGNWVPLDYKEALPLWHAEIAALPKYHVEPCHMITGAILPIWGMLPGACHVWRVQTDSGERMLGRVIPEESVADTLDKLGATMSEVTHSLDKILDTLAAGGHIALVNGWKIYQTMVLNEPRIAILGPTWEHVPDLRKEGVIIEQVYSRTGFYIPTGDRFQAVFEEVTCYRQIQKIVSKSAVA